MIKKMGIGNTRNKVSEVKKGIVFGILLTSFYSVGTYIYKTKIRIDDLKKNEKILDKDLIKQIYPKKYKKVNGHIYKWSEDQKSTFRIRNLGYEKRFSKTASLKELENELKDEYCTAVKEIKKVDEEIVPGTNIPFKEATYTQVDDAYKEYLQKIAQIRQIFFKIMPNNLTDFEKHIKCEYKSSRWNFENTLYLTKLFFSKEIDDYYSK